MSSTASDTWNNPQIPPPPPSPAVVGARFRDTSPTADADYEARYPEMTDTGDLSAKNTADTNAPADNTTPNTTAESSHPQRTDSTSSKAPPKKKKRTRSTGVEDATPRPHQPIQVPGQYASAPLPYYLPPYQNLPEAYNAPGCCSTTYGCTSGGLSPSMQVNPLPYPVVSPPCMVDVYRGNSYAPPQAHYPHPLPTPPATAYKAASEGDECQRYDSNSTIRASAAYKNIQEGGASDMVQEFDFQAMATPESGGAQMPPYYATPPPSPTFRVPTGYPFLAGSLAERPALQLYRRFEKLNHLVLLHLQDEIAELETTLAGLDEIEYKQNNGGSLRTRRGMWTGSRRLQVMGAIAFKLQEYNKALKGYKEMTDALSPVENGDLEIYKAWMMKRRPLVETEGRVVSDHPEDLARLYRRSKKSEVEISPMLKVGLTVLSCGIVGVASLRISRAADVPLALAAGVTGSAVTALWAFF